MIIVTSGQPFTDIDAFACAIAYSELLNLTNKNARAVLPGPLNSSVTKGIKNWGVFFDHIYKPTSADSFVLVDISETKFFAEFVDEENIVEIFDHRYGFEDYWKVKLGNKSHIEMVGACATLIWEMFIKTGKEKSISNESANLLYTAIVSNTLNFNASVTTNRDKDALDKLKNYVTLPNNWVEKYFKEQEKEVVQDIYGAIVNDTKDIEPVIAQLELWNSKEIILNNLKEIERAILSFNKSNWFLTSPSISEGKNYIFAKNKEVKSLLEKTIKAKFNGDIGTTDRLWLRKEIYKKLQTQKT